MTFEKQIFWAGIIALAQASIITAQPTAVKDHPLVSRFGGSAVVESSVTEYEEYPLAVGPYRGGKFTKLEKIEGKITHFRYSIPQNHAPLEIMRSYENALRQGGFQILFSCVSAECGDNANTDDYHRWIGMWCNPCGDPAMRYLAARLTRPGGDVYVAIKTNVVSCWGCGPIDGTYLNVIETRSMQGGQVVVKSDALARDHVRTGHVSLYGIYFDPGKADLKPESDATLAEIAKLLAAYATLKLHVVGNTDNVGPVAANMALSKQRADAVVSALTTRYHAAPERFLASGAGPLFPLDTNRTEEGRAKNRRVELVEQ